MRDTANIHITLLRSMGTVKEATFLKALRTGFGRGKQLNEAVQLAKAPAFASMRSPGVLSQASKNMDAFSSLANRTATSPFLKTNPLAFRAGQMAGGVTNTIANPGRTLGQAARTAAIPALAGGVGYTDGNINGNVSGTANTLNYMTQNPMQAMGLGMASAFGKGHAAINSAVQSQLDAKPGFMNSMFLRNLLAKLKTLQTAPGPTS